MYDCCGWLLSQTSDLETFLDAANIFPKTTLLSKHYCAETNTYCSINNADSVTLHEKKMLSASRVGGYNSRIHETLPHDQ